jgi:hypothetical protein
MGHMIVLSHTTAIATLFNTIPSLFKEWEITCLISHYNVGSKGWNQPPTIEKGKPMLKKIVFTILMSMSAIPTYANSITDWNSLSQTQRNNIDNGGNGGYVTVYRRVGGKMVRTRVWSPYGGSSVNRTTYYTHRSTTEQAGEYTGGSPNGLCSGSKC